MPFQRKKPEANGTKAPFPGFIEPALATAMDRTPLGDRWIHEIKFDGCRVQVQLANEAVKVFTRRGHDWTHRFKKVADDAWHIKAASAIIDGEIVLPAADGTTDFSVLQNELKGKSTRIVVDAFDQLYLNGRDLRKLPLMERKAQLKKIIAGSNVQFSESFEVDGKEMFAHACKVGLEGVVLKVRDSAYTSGRGNNWVKKTCAQRETLTIAGFALDDGKWDGMYLLGRRVLTSSMPARLITASTRRLPRNCAAGSSHWSGKLSFMPSGSATRASGSSLGSSAEIEYRARSADGKVRHPFFRGLREDI